jgi:hypothetical protein
MAKTSSFGYQNADASTQTVALKSLHLTSNYALTAEDANNAVLSNRTAPIDAEELVTFRTRNIASVNTDLNIQNPSKVKSGIQYQVQLEDTLVTTDTDDASFRVDEPVVALLTIRHPRSGNITEAHIGEIFVRLISSLMKEDGSWRFADLMRGAERPIAD